MYWMTRILEIINGYLMKPDSSNQNLLYITAATKLGKDASPKNVAPSEFACAESVSSIIHLLWPEFPILTGTYTLCEELKRSSLFQQVALPWHGDVIISPTGTGNGVLKNGHAGVLGKDKIIMSNDSASGLWLENYTHASWLHKYKIIGGFPVYYFRRK